MQATRARLRSLTSRSGTVLTDGRSSSPQTYPVRKERGPADHCLDRTSRELLRRLRYAQRETKTNEPGLTSASIDPGGDDRNVTLEAEAAHSKP